MKRIRVARLAERDLDDIWSYTAKKSSSIDTTNNLVDSIIGHFALFAHTSEAGTLRDEVEPGVRGFPVGSYIIYYRENGPYVVISRVLHGRRDQRAAYSDE